MDVLYCQTFWDACFYMHLNFNDIPFLINRVNMELVHPFAALTSSTLLGRPSTRFRSVFMGTFDHSSTSAFVRSGTDVGWKGLACSLCSNSSQRYSIGLRSGLCESQSSSSTPNSLNIFRDLALFTGVPTVHWCFHKTKLFPQSWEHEIVQNVLVCWSIKISFHFPFLSPNFIFGTMQSGNYRYPGDCQTQTHPSDCQTEAWFVTTDHVSTALESTGSVLYTASNVLHCT